MYWIYFFIAITTIFVPSLVHKGHFGLSVAGTQELVILVLVCVCCVLFYVRDEQLHRRKRERQTMLRQLNRLAKDLNHSYSYIGEINRKLDILEQISYGLPDSANLTPKKRKEIFDSIMEAIQLFGKSEDFAIRFVKLPTHELLREVKSKPRHPMLFSQRLCEGNTQYFETEKYFLVSSPKAIDEIYACVVIKKKNHGHAIDDVEILKTLAAQALFLYVFMEKSEKNNTNS